jgi:hypothetical protein
MKELFKTFYQKVSATLYPPICLHCEEEMANNSFLFCESCAHLLTLSDLPKGGKYGWLFEKIGPAKTLYTSFAKGRQVVFSRTLASYLVIQMERFSWPLPDAIFSPTKNSSMRDLVRELSSLMKRPKRHFWQKEGIFLCISEEIDENLLSQMQEKMKRATIYAMGIFPKKK